jgi:tetratricopeptide (TPR) repeat protein
LHELRRDSTLVLSFKNRGNNLQRIGSGVRRIAALRAIVCACVLSTLLWAQQNQADIVGWQTQVRQYTQARDWNAALEIIGRQIMHFPNDLDVRAWRARVLLWSGRLREAEQGYLDILSISANDPDNWLGLATVYSREGRTQEAVQALDRAAALDSSRPDIHVARGFALRAIDRPDEATMEFSRALSLDANNAEAKQGLRSLPPIPKHELRIASNTDLFSFTSANQNAGLALTSRWTSHWGTMGAAEFYRWAGMDAEKVTANVTGKLPKWGAVTLGGAAANNNGVVPKNEALIGYSHGWKLRSDGQIRGVETDYEQHWYWYATARILTLNELVIFYLPGEWTWSFRLTGARSQFSDTSKEWRPSGFTRMGFPIAGIENHQLRGTLLFATGTENFAQADQIGRFSSQSYGGSLRFQFTSSQDVTGIAVYQKRTQERNETSFGLSYGIRF